MDRLRHNNRGHGAIRIGTVVRVAAAALLGSILLPTVSSADEAEVSAATRVDAVASNGPSSHPVVNATGQFVVFESAASNLVPDDTNGAVDVFIYDRVSGDTERVSVNSSGDQANGPSSKPAVSADGEIVVFESVASNLVAGDTNGASDIFVHNRQTGVTTRVSVASDGTQPASPSYDSHRPAISADGHFVAFDSSAWLVPAFTGMVGVYVHDLELGTTELVSVNNDGDPAFGTSLQPSLSADGRHVAFSSDASTLVSGDTNNATDVFVHDRTLGTTERVSVSVTGAQSTSGYSIVQSRAISDDGRYVTFESDVPDLFIPGFIDRINVHFRDRTGGTTVPVSADNLGHIGNDVSWGSATISSNGEYVAFQSWATNLVADDTNNEADVFIRNIFVNRTERVTLSNSGAQANGSSGQASLSGDGRYVAFMSLATNLVDGDTNDYADVFVRDRQTGETELISLGTSTPPATTTTTTTTSTTTTTTTMTPTTTTTVVPRRVVHGDLVSIKVDGRTVTVAGRARTVSGAPHITVSRNGKTLSSVNATRPRSDGYRGFVFTDTVTAGEYSYCAHFINEHAAGNYTKDCKNVTVK